ncbi:MAG TPA: Lrp/AsnC ligand binding domain-containing protein [Methanospirillum sp.]|nr:Lrp/AsnC ligand binding domain-containing protein [Methanospirillum sp.]
MAKAYLKIEIETGKEKDVQTALKKIEGVISADFVTGEQDLVALIESDSYEEIVTKKLNEVRKIQGIHKTITNFVFEWD